MPYTTVKDICASPESFADRELTLAGWVRTVRDSKAFGFIELNDGSCVRGIQIVLEGTLANFAVLVKLNVGAAIIATGTLVLTPEGRQPFELKAANIEIEGHSVPEYPLQKKRHSFEYLRSMTHLRPRTNTFNAVFHVRSEAAFAIHDFFHSRGFVYTHTPIISSNDAEGAGALFRVTTLDPNAPPLTEDGEVDYTRDFFGRAANLTVSGQLEGEAFALAFSKIYTFGPTFRAENSNTTRHAAEFWMVEPEIAFAGLDEDMELAEAMVKHIIAHVIDTCPHEMAFFNEFIDKELIERLTHVRDSDFGRMTYTEGIAILEAHKDKFEYPVYWGCDLQSEHERFLTEQIVRKPVFLTGYPKEIKSFYMRWNDDGKTVAAMDLFVPAIGELIGGSQREERHDLLLNRIRELGMSEEEYGWYLDLRRYGGTRHAGFGLGFERFLMYATGLPNIRDVLPFPRVPGVVQ